MSFGKFRISDLVIVILFLSILIIKLLVRIFAELLSILSKWLVNQDIVQVFQVFQQKHSWVFVTLVWLVTSQDEWIVLHVQHLQVVFQIFKIGERWFHLPYLILPEWENAQLGKSIETFDLLDKVRKKWEIGEFSQLSKSTDLLDLVETKVEPSQVD